MLLFRACSYDHSPIKSPADLGFAIRAVRRSSRVRIDDLAATAGVSKQFTSDVEHGKPTMQFGLVLKLLAELGVPLEVDVPEEAARAFERRLSFSRSAASPRLTSSSPITWEMIIPPPGFQGL